MSTPYDLDSPEPEQRPGGPQAGGGASRGPAEPSSSQAPPAPRASDILRDHPIYTQNQAPRTNNVNGGERAATKLDDFARGIFGIAILAVVLTLGYLLYGMWGGSLAEPAYSHVLSHADRLRIHNNLDTVLYGLRISIIVALVSLLFLFYHEESAGYVLLIVALFLDFALPFVTGFLLQFNREKPSLLTDYVQNGIRGLAWLPGIPGALLILYDIYRRIAGGLEEATIRRTTLRYGQGVSRQSRHKNIFLGPCWNTAFCRDAIRNKCPIFQQKKGPCWRHKRGCMCEESIILHAQSGDWKQRVAGAVTQIEGQKKVPGGGLLGTPAAGPVLNMEQKKERCRQCVIYNKHQEQKYKLLVAVTFAVVIGAVVFLRENLLGMVNAVTVAANSVIGRFSYTTAASAGTQVIPTLNSDFGGPLTWVILVVAALIVLAKLLQLVEYCCFKIKI